MKFPFNFLMLLFFFESSGQTAIWQEKAGVALNNLALYQDSSFSKPTSIFFSEGELFEVIGKSSRLYEDDAQKQLFYWYQVKSLRGQIGWIFGDAIAVSVPTYQLDPGVLRFQKKQFGKEKLVSWIAAVQGSEMNTGAANFFPPYREEYLVISPENEKSFSILISSESSSGVIELNTLEISDLTGDGLAEWIVERSSFANGQPFESRNLEIFGKKKTGFQKLFSEELTLSTTKNQPSPAWFKIVELDLKSIRIDFVDFFPCKNYGQPLEIGSAQSDESCLESITATYFWNQANEKFSLLYEPSRSAPVGNLLKDGVFLRERPDLKSKRVELLNKSMPLSVIKMVKTEAVEPNQPKYWFYVFSPIGELYGYLPASKLGFSDCGHSEWLNRFFAEGPDATERQTSLYLKTKRSMPDQ